MKIEAEMTIKKKTFISLLENICIYIVMVNIAPDFPQLLCTN